MITVNEIIMSNNIGSIISTSYKSTFRMRKKTSPKAAVLRLNSENLRNPGWTVLKVTTHVNLSLAISGNLQKYQ